MEIKSETWLAIVAVLSPILTFMGLYLQYYKDKKKSIAEAKKILVDADKVRAETTLIYDKADKDTINFYIAIMASLRNEVNTLTDMGKKNSSEIVDLMIKLDKTENENRLLQSNNYKLVELVNSYEVEVKALRKEVKELKELKDHGLITRQ